MRYEPLLLLGRVRDFWNQDMLEWGGEVGCGDGCGM